MPALPSPHDAPIAPRRYRATVSSWADATSAAGAGAPTASRRCGGTPDSRVERPLLGIAGAGVIVIVGSSSPREERGWSGSVAVSPVISFGPRRGRRTYPLAYRALCSQGKQQQDAVPGTRRAAQ